MNKLILMLLTIFSLTSVADGNGRDAIKYIPIQNGGRVKPFDTFAQESLQLLHGKRSKDGKPATDIIMTMFMVPEMWMTTKFLAVKNFEVKRDLGFDEKENFFSFNEITQAKPLPLLMQKLRDKEQTKEKLNPYDQAIQKIDSQIYLIQAITSGMALTIIPQKAEKNTTTWQSIPGAEGEAKKLFMEISALFAQSIAGEVSAAKNQGTSPELAQKVSAFIAAARAENPNVYPTEKEMKIEVFYNSLHPFKWAWILYFFAGLFFGLSLTSKRFGFGYQAGWLFFVAGLVFHLLGFGLRTYISGRPPVSNMYETVIWVAFGGLLFSVLIERVTKYTVVLLGGCMVAIFCLILADIAPTILDPSLQPLEPVLMSNFWLIIHVMTITISYSAFFLALAMGNMGLYYFIRGEANHRQTIENITNAIYRALQLGVVLLAAGIILGGVWADYSWGRFWGWDPKETWALIALLGYLAILHGRMGGWLKNFGMNAWSIIGFALVIMAWYGVNFVLGAGLHTYGFGAGGIEYVLGFVFIQFLFVIYAFMVHRGKSF